jgi:DNA-binding GntR family transcriptional regulator
MARQAGSKTKTGKLEPFRGIKPVGKPRPVGEVVYDSLKEAIVKGDLTPGLRLVEQQLSLQMKTSRIPVREALKRLEQEGLVQKHDRRGFVVKSFSRKEIEETFGIRAVLESYAAFLATENMSDALIERLEQAIDAYRKALDRSDMEKLLQYNTQFHEIMYKAADSRKLYDLISNFRNSFYRYRKSLLAHQGHARIALDDHVEMVSAMKSRDKERVETVVRRHILRGKEIVLKEMDAGNPV